MHEASYRALLGIEKLMVERSGEEGARRKSSGRAEFEDGQGPHRGGGGEVDQNEMF
jgi:hypothetical protein